MQVNTNYNSPSFGFVKFTPETRPLLRKMTIEQLEYIKQLKEEAKKTNNWDLEIDYNKYTDNFSPVYKNRDNSAYINKHSCGLDAYGVEGDTVRVRSYTCDENVYDELEFSSPERAAEAYEVMQGDSFNLPPYERAVRYIKSLKFLDESYEFMKKE